MVVCKTRYMDPVYGMPPKLFSGDLKKFPKPRFSGALELRGEGGRGSRGGGGAPPPPAGMKIKASPPPPPPRPTPEVGEEIRTNRRTHLSPKRLPFDVGLGRRPQNTPSFGGVFAQRQSSRHLSREHPCKPPIPGQKYATSIQNRIGGAKFRTLGPVATGAGKQPTFCTAHVAPPRTFFNKKKRLAYPVPGIFHVYSDATHMSR